MIGAKLVKVVTIEVMWMKTTRRFRNLKEVEDDPLLFKTCPCKFKLFKDEICWKNLRVFPKRH